MKLITQRGLILGVADRWREQYSAADYARDPEKQDIQRKLDALDKKNATASDVEKIIGNNSWTTVDDCDECGRKARAVVEIGAEPDYESATARVCVPCLRKAIKLATT